MTPPPMTPPSLHASPLLLGAVPPVLLDRSDFARSYLANRPLEHRPSLGGGTTPRGSTEVLQASGKRLSPPPPALGCTAEARPGVPAG